jgi:DNA modification methylase
MIKIKPSNKNTNKHTESGMQLLEHSINKAGVLESISVATDGTIISGHARKEIFDKKGMVAKEIELKDNEFAVIKTKIEPNTKEYYEAQILANTTANKNFNLDTDLIEEIVEEFDIDVEEVGVEIVELGNENNKYEKHESLTNPKKLSERFIIPPLSVLDTKQGAWQQRKNYWLSLGIKSEIGRNNVLSGDVKGTYNNSKDSYNIFNTFDVSVFDPVLCELAYQWFNVPNGKILDPFAGGSVRGIVAAKLGFEYLGNDLRKEQIEANKINAKEVLQDAELYPTWTCGDSLNIDTIAKDYKADMIFSCPPYADLEVYSDLKEDISNMPYQEFLTIYKEIIRKSCDMLNEDRFAVFVVSEVREKQEFYYGFIKDTINAFTNCNVKFYNDIVLYNMIGRTAMTCVKGMRKRKVGKVHQNVLVFYKGNPKNIKQNYPELDLSYINNIDQ